MPVAVHGSIAAAHFGVLSLLHSRALSKGELAELMGIKPSTVIGIINAAHDLGLVRTAGVGESGAILWEAQMRPFALADEVKLSEPGIRYGRRRAMDERTNAIWTAIIDGAGSPEQIAERFKITLGTVLYHTRLARSSAIRASV